MNNFSIWPFVVFFPLHTIGLEMSIGHQLISNSRWHLTICRKLMHISIRSHDCHNLNRKKQMQLFVFLHLLCEKRVSFFPLWRRLANFKHYRGLLSSGCSTTQDNVFWNSLQRSNQTKSHSRVYSGKIYINGVYSHIQLFAVDTSHYLWPRILILKIIKNVYWLEIWSFRPIFQKWIRK